MHETELLVSKAEIAAQLAQQLPAFGGLNLAHIKRNVSVLLGLIGRQGIFDQYTIHDISHINKMLNSLDWLVPEPTQEVMSPADWLMTVLSIYFHDMGMLVTELEYANRNASEFPQFRDAVLLAGAPGSDYSAKVSKLPAEQQERFLYQDFVRYKHAERIKYWISGNYREDAGDARAVGKEIATLLSPLKEQFRRDLGLICESHHLDDLYDLKKYKPSQPYGDSDAETANLQYCAVLLRASDLLHVTSDRTPSVAFRVINPTDPVSQQEWAKQMAVTRVRPKPGLNEEGEVDASAPKDTIEVHAYFKNENGFFGLTSYIAYTTDQLRKCNEWISTSRKQKKAPHEFPWRKIDDSHIETEGFLRDTFEFGIDQGKILDLLTGHTLYNDTRVVLRELVQNSIDAIRIQHHPDSAKGKGKILIHWDSSQSKLSVSDNGTGMTQEIINKYLLRAGSSRYQDPEFKKNNPTFSSISRFGIGVLSSFMIADTLEIFTCHRDEDQARHLTLRSVHGKYLIRLLEKTDSRLQSVAEHGTIFLLHVRPSVKMPDILDAAKLWFVVPECEITVQVDSSPGVRVGSESVGAALVSCLKEYGLDATIAGDTTPPPESSETNLLRVIETSREGVSLAYGLRWNAYFREWSFLTATDIPRATDPERVMLGTCIEGIRVEFDSPGFQGPHILAIANVTGITAPRTNVARSGLEDTPERNNMFKNTYAILGDHIGREVTDLQKKRSMSLTWALSEAKYLARPLIQADAAPPGRPINRRLLDEVLRKQPLFAIEKNGRRAAISAAELGVMSEFWTIDCQAFHSAEPLLREAGQDASLAGVVKALNIPNFLFGESPVLCGITSLDAHARFAFDNREVDQIIVSREHRRVDLRWVDRGTPPRWISLADVINPRLRRLLNQQRRGNQLPISADTMQIGMGNVDVRAPAKEVAVKALGLFYLFPGTLAATFLQPYVQQLGTNSSADFARAVLLLHQILGNCLTIPRPIPNPDEHIRRYVRLAQAEWPESSNFLSIVTQSDLADLLSTTPWKIFDSSQWVRQTEANP